MLARLIVDEFHTRKVRVGFSEIEICGKLEGEVPEFYREFLNDLEEKYMVKHPFQHRFSATLTAKEILEELKTYRIARSSE